VIRMNSQTVIGKLSVSYNVQRTSSEQGRETNPGLQRRERKRPVCGCGGEVSGWFG